MKKKIIKIILLFAFILVFRYVGLYKCIDSGNIQLLKVMSFCNPLINVSYVNFNKNTLDDIITIEVEDCDVKNEMLKILKEAREQKAND